MCKKLSQSTSVPAKVNPVTMTTAPRPSTSGTSGTVTMAATKAETQTAIAVLLSLGSDLPAPNVELDENAALVPLVPEGPTLGAPMLTTDEVQTIPLVIGTAIKEEQKLIQPKAELPTEKKKKTFVTVEYKLKRKYVNTKHKFPCEKYHQNFGSQREVNEHFRTTHLPVQYDTCQKT